jgi:uncharacterized membrane-anchored protein YjiN (DUF445 family)
MTATAAPAPTAPLEITGEADRRRRLALMKRRATALLGAVTVVFLVVTLVGGDAAWAGYLQAAAEGGMVGGLADWFAVVALFRLPLGIPIPHTGIVVERKDQFAATLGGFIQDAFLTREAIVARLRAAKVVPRIADWLTRPANAERVAAEVLDGAVTIVDLLRDEDVHRVMQRFVEERLTTVPLSPLAGKSLRFAIRDGRHQQALDVALRELDRYLDENDEQLRLKLGGKSPWWLPNAAEDRIFERLIAAAHTVIAEMLEDKEHNLRSAFEARLVVLAHDLEHDPAYLERGERLKHDVLDQPETREWMAAIWTDAKDTLRAQAADPSSELRRRLSGAIVTIGTRLHDDPALQEKASHSVETAALYAVDRFQGEISGLVESTIARWDAEETATRLELLLGPDLQFIRVNGTVVGAAAGLALHAIAQLLG